jgi:hypothetical protein
MEKYRMSLHWKKTLAHFIPAHIHDPFGLTLRMLRSQEPAAYFSMAMALLGVLCTPLDLIFQLVERQYYKSKGMTDLPLIFVCGASRTGTTVASQILIKYLPVGYLSNVIALFPRSPIISTLLFDRFLNKQAINYRSYYGKSSYFSGPNEGFFLWNRWMKADKDGVRCLLMEDKKEEMARFFHAYLSVLGKPLLHKHNDLSMCASAVAEALLKAHFICMTRDPAYLAQSLLIARTEIQGGIHIRYGVHDPHLPESDDYVEDVCRQVLFHERLLRTQEKRIGPQRFWIVSYEEFCAKPYELVKRVSEHILGKALDSKASNMTLPPLQCSNTIKVAPDIFARIEHTLQRLQHTETTLEEF